MTLDLLKSYLKKHPIRNAIIILIIGWLSGIFTPVLTHVIISKYDQWSKERSDIKYCIKNVSSIGTIGNSSPIQTLVTLEFENKGTCKGNILFKLAPNDKDKIVKVHYDKYLIKEIASENEDIKKFKISNLEPNKPTKLTVELSGNYVYSSGKEVLNISYEEE